MKKRLGIDARLFGQTGVGVYIENLLLNLRKHVPSSWEIIVYTYGKPVLPSSIKKRFIVKESNYKWHSLGEQIGFLRQLEQDNLHLMHFTYFSYPAFYKKPFISTIHDLTHLTFKSGQASTKNPLIYQIKHYALRFLLSEAINNASFVITPSAFVKGEITKYFGSQKKDTIVPIYEGVGEKIKRTKPNNALRKSYAAKFFLYVGNFYPHKNVEQLICAFSKIKTKEVLILTGPDDFFTSRVVQLIKQLNQKERVMVHKNPSRADLVFFYKNAKALVNPSLAEGFGLTNLEAVYFDCPIIASEIPVFHEILGDSFLSFDPHNPDDIAAKIEGFINKKPSHTYVALRNGYSFDKMTRETVQLYKKLLSS